MSGPNLFIYMASCHSNRITTEIHNQMLGFLSLTLQWCHNGRDSVSSHQSHECLLKRLFRRRSRKTSKLRVTGLCVGNSSVTGEIPTQNTEKVSFWWLYHAETTRPLSSMGTHIHIHSHTDVGVTRRQLWDLLFASALDTCLWHRSQLWENCFMNWSVLTNIMMTSW